MKQQKRKRRIFIRGNVIPNAKGAASSAAKFAGKSGVAQISSAWLWVPGEGWVRWTEIHAQVTAAFDDWRMRRALAGKTTWDGWEAIQSDIAEARAKRELCAA